MVTAGPGLTNTVTAVKNAQMAESALLLIGGAAPTLLKGRGGVVYHVVSLADAMWTSAFIMSTNLINVALWPPLWSLRGLPGNTAAYSVIFVHHWSL